MSGGCRADVTVSTEQPVPVGCGTVQDRRDTAAPMHQAAHAGHLICCRAPDIRDHVAAALRRDRTGRARVRRRLSREDRFVAVSPWNSQPRQPLIVSASPQMAEILALVGRVAARRREGAHHRRERRRQGSRRARDSRALRARRRVPFIAVNCAGLTETLLESELFGHVKGSFTGAYRDKPGKLQLAHRGTLFLDEVGEMSLRMQALLLRFLENGEIQSVGADHARRRWTCASSRRPTATWPDMVSTGQFREDLLYRLRVIHIHVPPLRERSEDMRVLVGT